MTVLTRRYGGIAALLAGLAVLLAALAPGDARAQTVLTVSGRLERARPLPSDFLGIAIEYRSVPALVGPNVNAVNPVLVQLLRNLDPGGRSVLRIGGLSTDRSWWPVAGMRRPLGVTYALTTGWIADARALAEATGSRLLLGLNLEANRTRIPATEAWQLLAGIGADNIAAMEIGNEPDLYTLIPWYRVLGGRPAPWYLRTGAPVYARRPGYGPSQFLAEFARTARLLPRVALAGPVTGLTPWLDGFTRLLSPSSAIRIVTSHAYGLNQCVTAPGAAQYPSVPNLLAPAASRELANGIGPYIALAHRYGASFRIDEMGSVSCNGRAGVSDTFASALWALDGLFGLAASGVDGVNLHTFPQALNALFDFSLAGGEWEATVRPIYYGALMFAHAAPPGSRLLQITAPPQPTARAWATIAPDRHLRVVVINDSLRRRLSVVIKTPSATGPAAVERLQAPSAYATSGVTLGEQSFGAQTPTGLLPAPAQRVVTARGRGYRIAVPAASAVLLTFPPGAEGAR